MQNPSSKPNHEIQRIGIIFAGGPAPGANAVISSAAISFLEAGHDVVGFFHGYANLQDYHPVARRLVPDTHYRQLELRDVRGMRNARGILIGTARANPGKMVDCPADLDDPVKTQPLSNVYKALVDLRIDALISIGGDDTLKTANKLYEFQKRLPKEAKRVRVIHLPKTIDNDYKGIDFTFGFFTAVDWMAKEVQNLRADALATSSYFIVETMGRKAGWLSYGVAIAGEANMVVGVEDIPEIMRKAGKEVDPENVTLDLEVLTKSIVDIIIIRERYDKYSGTIVLAEGIAECLDSEMLEGITRDEHGHISLGDVHLGKLIANRVAEEYMQRTGNKKKVNGVQLGYESRCAPAHAYDIMLGSQLGIGAYRALIEEKVDGHMVSVGGQLDLFFVPFSDVVNSETLLTEIRFVKPGSDFHRLARFLETRTDRITDWDTGRRPENV